MGTNSNKKGYRHFNFGTQMKYIHSLDEAQIKAEFTNEKGVLLNALHSEFLQKNIRTSMVLLN